MKSIIIILQVLILSSCKFRDDQKLPKSDETYKSMDQYLSTFSPKSGETKEVAYFVFANNPYSLDSTYYLSIFANNVNVYFGNFKKSVPIDAKNLNGPKRINFMFEVLKCENATTYRLNRFQNKTTIAWQKDYKFIYACFLPSNDEGDKILFLPYKDDINY